MSTVNIQLYLYLRLKVLSLSSTQDIDKILVPRTVPYFIGHSKKNEMTQTDSLSKIQRTVSCLLEGSFNCKELQQQTDQNSICVKFFLLEKFQQNFLLVWSFNWKQLEQQTDLISICVKFFS